MRSLPSGDADVLGFGEEAHRLHAAFAAQAGRATPPNGVRRSRISQVLTQTMPARSCAATRWARSRSRVQTDAARP